MAYVLSRTSASYVNLNRISTADFQTVTKSEHIQLASETTFPTILKSSARRISKH